jgi:hypothetical protein
MTKENISKVIKEYKKDLQNILLKKNTPLWNYQQQKLLIFWVMME